jgi:hypothetical protein
VLRVVKKAMRYVDNGGRVVAARNDGLQAVRAANDGENFLFFVCVGLKISLFPFVSEEGDGDARDPF